MPVEFIVNGRSVSASSPPLTPLLEVLRVELGLTGTKQGCDREGECGACIVLLDGQAVNSCLTPLIAAAGKEVTTIEGLGQDGKLNPLQQAFIEAGAIQCGYCTPGMVMSAWGLLLRQPNPSREEIVEALQGNLCRCTGYAKIISAVQAAAARLRGEPPAPTVHLGVGADGEKTQPAPLGGSAWRKDSVDKVTGRARYAEDISMPGMLHAGVLRSRRPHARLKRLDLRKALSLPGVVCILTAEDIPGVNGFPEYSVDEPVLTPVGDTLRQVGAPIALAAAETAEQARAAVEAIEIELEELPHTYDQEAALHPDFPTIAGNHNILSTYEVKHGDIRTALIEADVVLEQRYDTAFLEHSALEREALVGYIDEEERVAVIGGSHQPHNQQRYLAGALGLPLEKTRIIQPPMGGSFGGKQDPWPLTAVGLLVYHTQRPVKLAFDATPKRHPYIVRYRIGAKKDGRFTGIWTRIDCNTGGYDGGGRFIPNYALTAAGGAYRWEAVDGEARSIYTNGPKAGQYRGFGTAQSTFALECALDELAEILGVDPLEMRLKNCLREGERSFLGYPLAETLGYEQALRAVQPFYQDFGRECAAFNERLKKNGDGVWLRRGVGLAGMWYRFGKAGQLRIEAHAELAQDGHFVIYCSAPDYGQGTNTTMEQIAAETFGVSRERVELVNADTARTPNSDIQGASRATYFVGGAVRQAAANLKDEILGAAAELLDRPVPELAIQEERVIDWTNHGRSVTLAEVAAEFDRIGKARRIIGIFDLSPEFPDEGRPEYLPIFTTGVQVAEVEVDMHTGYVQVRRVVAAHDVGRAVNPPDVEGQVEGAVVMGIGAALMEEFIPGLTRGGFAHYHLPTIDALPDIQVIMVEAPSRMGPYGVKGLGEAAMLPSSPALINAVSRAIGVRLRSLPAKLESVLEAIHC